MGEEIVRRISYLEWFAQKSDDKRCIEGINLSLYKNK
jgi:hypothetical protein